MYSLKKERKEFIYELWEKVDSYPKDWRLGQKVFNAVEELYGRVARDVQFKDGVDCFYMDNKIDDFINAVWERLKDETE